MGKMISRAGADVASAANKTDVFFVNACFTWNIIGDRYLMMPSSKKVKKPRDLKRPYNLASDHRLTEAKYVLSN